MQNSAFSLPVRVYYEDTDAGGLVYYANYLKYLERPRTEWLRELGVEQSMLLGRDRIAFVVRSLGIEFLRPARLDDLLESTARVAAVGRAQVDLDQVLRRESEILVSARVKVVCIDADRMRPVALPSKLAAQFKALATSVQSE